MKSLLVVEDEKMIRHGIAVMAKRCSVEIEEIIECRNGEEAMEILTRKNIDVMFTDIRMPKMDGIELVKEAEKLGYKTDIVVISGYDDFNYAVEMLKHGVSDYILKPVKRDKIEEILTELDAHRRQMKEKEKDRKKLFTDLATHALTSGVEEDEFERIKKFFKTVFGESEFRVLVLPGEAEIYEEENRILYLDLDGQKVIFVRETEWKELCERKAWNYTGISGICTDFSRCRIAYQEAYKARICAFFSGDQIVEYKDIIERQQLPFDNETFADKFVAAFTTKDWERYKTELMNLFFEVRHGRQNPFRFLDNLEKICAGLHDTYDHIVPEDKRKLLSYQKPLQTENGETYQKILAVQINDYHNSLEELYIQDQNKRKMRRAVEYIRKYYDKDLNMAVVSNFVSMNYSLFSLSFKEYTGVNFVNYLKEIRISKAKELLENTDWKIQEISAKVGYENEKNFMKVFKNICGISPTEYRKNLNLKQNID